MKAPWVIVDTATDRIRCRRCLTSVRIRSFEAEALVVVIETFVGFHAGCLRRGEATPDPQLELEVGA